MPLINVAILYCILGTQQEPPATELQVVEGGNAQLTYKVFWNAQVKGYHLFVGYNGIIFTEGIEKEGLFAVVYNGCTDSNHPQEVCMEAQTTVQGNSQLNSSLLSFHIYGEWNPDSTNWDVKIELASVKIVLVGQSKYHDNVCTLLAEVSMLD